MSEYVVVLERAEDGGWGAYLPDLPGVVALGSSREEVAERIREALDACTGDGGPSPAATRTGRDCRDDPGGLTAEVAAPPLMRPAPSTGLGDCTASLPREWRTELGPGAVGAYSG
jgi:predicted RNase H-like HicB family nuclease